MTRSALNNPAEPAPVLTPRQSYASVTDHIMGVPQSRVTLLWLMAIGAALAVVGLMLVSIAVLFWWGVGVWGINIPVGWGFAIINFVWWIGIGHAGTLISAILLLLRQEWRNSINRFAEAMTLFAVANAGLFPLLHLGRIVRFYYILPYPNTLGLWPQWRSPLVWDVFAVLTYFTVSLLFWYVGLIPDLATLRDRARPKWARLLSGVFALGWRNSARHWQRHQMAYLLLAGIATPLVVSVHSIVSLDFSTGIVPGWHSTIFPPYFVAGAIYSGFAMVLTLILPARAAFGFHNLITDRHLNNMAKVMLVSGLIVAYGYTMEAFTAWYSGDEFEIYMVGNRLWGDYWYITWMTLACNVAVPQLLWLRRVRLSPVMLFVVAQFINVGMWGERFMIVITSLHRDFMPSAWGFYVPTFWDWSLFIGTIGLFLFLILLFVRFLPMISAYEIRELVHHHADQHEPQPAPQQETPQSDRREAMLAEVDEMQLYGLVAEYEHAEQVLDAARRVREAGYTKVDAYTPFPLGELPEAMGLRQTRVPALALVGAVLGAGGGYFMQWYSSVIDYPFNIGGRPYHSWPSFVPLTFELGVLGAALFIVFGMLALNGLPRPYHPIFHAPAFDRASRDRFFICIEKKDPSFDRNRVRRLLESTNPVRVTAIPE